MTIWEFILAGVLTLVFAALMYGAWLMVEDKEREYRNRQNGRKSNE